MRELVHLMGNPERTYPSVHLTGTNGKGSTAAMITLLLSQDRRRGNQDPHVGDQHLDPGA
jgi:dihydrofolate synthase/folylpolyglutamate synthase